MGKRTKVRGKLNRQFENLEFRKRFDEGYGAFELEVQVLNALERKGWSYAKLAEATGTSKSNVSRDLKSGGILSASFSRISRIAEALGMRLVALLIPKDQAEFIVPQLHDIVRSSFNAAYGGVHAPPLASAAGACVVTTNAATYFTRSHNLSPQIEIDTPKGALG